MDYIIVKIKKIFNLSTNIISIFNYIKNYIIAKIEIKEEDINKEIQIINSCEEWKRSNGLSDEEEYNIYKNEKVIKENC